MFGPPGRLYTYRADGIHVCANVSCGTRWDRGGRPARAAALEAGTDVARPDAAQLVRAARAGARSGQSVLGSGITMDDNGLDLFDPDDPVTLELNAAADRRGRSPRRHQPGRRPAVAIAGLRADRRSPLSPQPPGSAPGEQRRARNAPNVELLGEKLSPETAQQVDAGRRATLWEDCSVMILDELGWRGLIAAVHRPRCAGRRSGARADDGLRRLRPDCAEPACRQPGAAVPLRRFQNAGHRPDLARRRRHRHDRRPGGKQDERQLLDRAPIEGYLETDPPPAGASSSTSPTGALAAQQRRTGWAASRPSSSCATWASTSRSTRCWPRIASRRRFERPDQGISYTEFSYMLLQANDYLASHRRPRLRRCRSAAATSGATSSPGSAWSARSSAPPCMR